MKRLIRRTKGLIKGTPVAILLSAGFHLVLLLIATTMVVVTIVQRQEAKFVPTQVNRPKMDLKKLRVKVKESARPRRTSERITAARGVATLPDIQLPALTGMGSGLEGSIGGFEMMADLSKMTLFGGARSLGNDLEGTLYYFYWDRQGNPISRMHPNDGDINPNFTAALNRFLESNWDPETLSEFWRSPAKLYASHFMMPPYASNLATEKFGLPFNTIAASYLVYYKGKIAHPTGGRFRFWGSGDDMLFVRINGKMVLDARVVGDHTTEWKTPEKWKSSSPESGKYLLGISVAVIGDWFTLEPGVPVTMEVLIGEDQGGRTTAMLNVEQAGTEYPKNAEGMPILPAFKTMAIPQHIIDEIEYALIPGESDLAGGPVFSAY